jgi:penicillin-binding protein 1C
VALANLRLDGAVVPLRAALAPHVAQRLAPGAGAPTPVRSTLDARLQTRVTELARQQVLGLNGRNVQDAAVLVVDNATGDVLAYLGSVGSLSPAPAVDGVMAPRQAGSTLKPFLYAAAIERRLLTAASPLEDRPVEYASTAGLYRPRNYDQRFHGGEVTLRVALAASLNVPAVRTLDLLGPEALVRVLRTLRIPALREGGHYGPSLALGSAEVRLWDLVGAYRMLALGGRWSALRLAGGAEAGPQRPVFSPRTAFIVSDILADRESRALTFGLESPLALRYWTAVKTGTSKDMRDNWCVGFSRRYTAGVWVGNFSGEPMWNVSGVTGAAPLWSAIMAVLHEGEPSPPPLPPPGLVRQGNPAEWFIRGTEPGAEGFHPATRRTARIRYPHAGMIIAIDPDIPPQRQAVFLEMEGPPGGLYWAVNGRLLGDARQPRQWPVGARGLYEVSLRTQEGHVLDSVRFQVRGGSLEP